MQCIQFQLVNVNETMRLEREDGSLIEPKASMMYLGTTLAADGMVGSELNRRLGRAWAEFCKLKQFWKHISISLARKVEVFNAVVASVLLYSLSTVWLSARQRSQLDGLQARCLRCILKIPPAFLSRVPNKTVLGKSAQEQFSLQLLRQQLLLFGRVARAPDDDCRRRLTFCPGSLQPATSRYVRRVGRPRAEWAPKLMETAIQAWSSADQVSRLIQDETTWRWAVLAKF